MLVLWRDIVFDFIVRDLFGMASTLSISFMAGQLFANCSRNIFLIYLKLRKNRNIADHCTQQQKIPFVIPDRYDSMYWYEFIFPWYSRLKITVAHGISFWTGENIQKKKNVSNSGDDGVDAAWIPTIQRATSPRDRTFSPSDLCSEHQRSSQRSRTEQLLPQQRRPGQFQRKKVSFLFLFFNSLRHSGRWFTDFYIYLFSRQRRHTHAQLECSFLFFPNLK